MLKLVILIPEMIKNMFEVVVILTASKNCTNKFPDTPFAPSNHYKFNIFSKYLYFLLIFHYSHFILSWIFFRIWFKFLKPPSFRLCKLDTWPHNSEYAPRAGWHHMDQFVFAKGGPATIFLFFVDFSLFSFYFVLNIL